MKRLTFLMLALSLVALGCDDDNGTAPSGLPVVFSAQLSPANEVPAVSNAENSGRGAMQVTITPTRSTGGAITAATATFHIQLYDFPGGTRIQGAHIHTGNAGVNGAIVVSTGISAASPVVLENGGTSVNITGISVDPAIAQGIIDNPSAWYFNVHSPLNPGGFARGQLSAVR